MVTVLSSGGTQQDISEQMASPVRVRVLVRSKYKASRPNEQRPSIINKKGKQTHYHAMELSTNQPPTNAYFGIDPDLRSLPSSNTSPPTTTEMRHDILQERNALFDGAWTFMIDQAKRTNRRNLCLGRRLDGCK